MVLVRPDSSPQLRLQWSRALATFWQDPHTQIVGVLLDNAEAPPFLADRQNLRADDDFGWQQLESLVRQRGPTAPQQVDSDELSNRLRSFKLQLRR